MTLLSPQPASPGLTGPVGPGRLPAPRGPVTDQLLDHLARPVHDLSPLPITDSDAIADDDLTLALYVLYELHYLGYSDVDEAWEWEPTVLRERRRMELHLERRLIELAGPVPLGVGRDQAVEELKALASAEGRPSLSRYMAESGTLDQMREFAIHRSTYQLKEADPHTWAIPRLRGRAKAALVDIQYGEYGSGDFTALHSALFAEVLSSLNLDPAYGAYLDQLPAVTLSTCNLVSLFGLHRRWRGALVGHLALFEMCSVGPMGRYEEALRRFGLGERATRFYAEHVRADERHQEIALHEMVAGLIEDEPFLGGEVVFGARAVDAVEALFADHLLGAWTRCESSLRPSS